ncbi:MAG: hypothetical protein M4579_000518 [Chaenotheca gracillima]|nr:MAG: hypothetical protein M4579_000518 [Chaenotheca gracillima]
MSKSGEVDRNDSPTQEDGGAEHQSSRPSKFRFKSKRKRRIDDVDEIDDQDPSVARWHLSGRPRRHHHRHHHGHHRAKRRETAPQTPPDDPSLYDDTYLPNTRSENYMDPDTAFRESLFDALADDEGASYWEGVYGQPVHTYPNARTGPDGKLEQMTDEEYTAHVRSRMWEKTHQHEIEEREKREARRQERARLRKETARMENDRSFFETQLEGSLRRGEERKRKVRWRDRWANYLKAWELMKKGGDAPGEPENGSSKRIKDRIPWPTESGKMKNLSVDEVEKFFRNAQVGTGDDALSLVGILKVERVRWHPDKIQHRLGSEGLDPGIVKAVTAIFQVVDRLWAEERDKKT